MSTSTARSARTSPAVRPGPSRGPQRAPLTVVPHKATVPARAPFVALVVTMLGGGLVGLLLLNTALAEGAFHVAELRADHAALVDQQQQLQQEVSRLSTPEVLARRARGLGMVPGGSPAFLDPDSGTVSGVPTPAPEPAVPVTGGGAAKAPDQGVR